MKRRTTLILCGALCLLAACSQPAPPDTRADDERAIRELDAQWSQTAGKLDVDGSVAFYSDDAVLLPPNAPAASTKAAIREAWTGLLAPGVAVSWKISRIEVAKAGDLAYLTGTYDLSMKEPAITDKGKLMEVWKKQADGKWKCIADTFNSDLPLPAPPKK